MRPFAIKQLGILPVAIGVGVLAAIAIPRGVLSSHHIEKSHRIYDGANTVLNDLLDAETGVRGFSISGDDDFLGPYKAALERIGRDTYALRELTEDEPQQSERMKQLEPLIAKKLALLHDGIEMRRNQGLAAVVEASKLKRGKITMDAIRAIIADMKQGAASDVERRLGIVSW